MVATEFISKGRPRVAGGGQGGVHHLGQQGTRANSPKDSGAAPWQILDVILFWRFPLTPDEFLHGARSIGKLISLAFLAYVERPKNSTYATWVTVLVCAAPEFRIWIEVGVDDDLKFDVGNVMGVSTTVMSSSTRLTQSWVTT